MMLVKKKKTHSDGACLSLLAVGLPAATVNVVDSLLSVFFKASPIFYCAEGLLAVLNQKRR
jgi:hypothetical protein